MKQITIIFLLITAFLSTFSCTSDAQQGGVSSEKVSIDTEGLTIADRFPTPTGYTRTLEKVTSFAHYLRNFKLKPAGTEVKYYDGSVKRNKVHAAVLDIDTGTRDLQQCADAVMRLRGEYLFAQKDFDNIHFNYTSGFNCNYSKWRQGYRPIVNGNKVTWQKRAEPNSSHASFRKYMNSVFAYAGTHSLEKELKPISLSDLQIGDVFIQGGFPGHAVIVIDLAENTNGEKIFLLAQSYMPAQNIHVLKNPKNRSKNAWYSVANIQDRVQTPEWTFNSTDLRRF